MAACFRLNTDALMASMFAVSEGPFSVEDMYQCLIGLGCAFPAHLVTDFDSWAVERCAEAYPTLYVWEDGVVSSGPRRPNLNYFLYPYSARDRKAIMAGVKLLLERKTPV